MKKSNLFYIAILLFLLISYSIFFWLDFNTILKLGQEDGFFETLTALFFLGTSLLFLITYFKDQRGNHFFGIYSKKNLFFLFLGILFFFGFGEEISWGQRIFDVETPEVIKEINIQKEINIHNLKFFHGDNEDGSDKSFFKKLLNIDRLFSIFWLTFCFLIPLLKIISPLATSFFKKINLPIVPIGIGAFFIGNYILSKFMESYDLRLVVEVKECMTSFLFFLVSLYFYYQNAKA